MPYCFVPGCNSGYKSCKEKRHMFRVKQGNDEQLMQWKRLIPRDDREFTFKDSICNLHFDQRFIKNTFDHIINGQEVKVEMGKWRLTEDAKPTIFPNLPHYLTKKLPPQRTSPRRRKSVLALTNSYNRKRSKRKSGKTLVNALQIPTNGVNEKSVVSSSELPIPVSKIKQETEEVILPSNDEHRIYTLNQRPQVPVIINVRRDDIDDDNTDKQYQESNTKKKQEVSVIETSLPERKRNFPDSSENSFIEEYYKAKLEVLNKEHNAKLNAIKTEYELKIKFLKEEYEYKLAYLKSKKEYKVLKKQKLQNT